MIVKSHKKWPKELPGLTDEQLRISDDFMKSWHEILPKRFKHIERFNHTYPLKSANKDFRTTLEIGAGIGEHLHYETLTREQEENYYALELRENMAAEIRLRFPKIQTVSGDCQIRLKFEDGFFDRILAIHVLEHLPDLPSCIREMHRLCAKKNGRFQIVIPCEGGFAYALARKISAERLYAQRYGGSYKWLHTREHINLPNEILEELKPYFHVEKQSFFPLPFLPFVFNSLCIGINLVPRSL